MQHEAVNAGAICAGDFISLMANFGEIASATMLHRRFV